MNTRSITSNTSKVRAKWEESKTGLGKGAAKNEAHSSMKYTQIQQLSKNEEGFVGMLHLRLQNTVNVQIFCVLFT